VQAGEGGAECGGFDLLTQAPKIWSLLRAPLGPQNEFFLCMVQSVDSATGDLAVRPILDDLFEDTRALINPPALPLELLRSWNGTAHARPEDWAKLWGVEVSSPVLSPSQPV